MLDNSLQPAGELQWSEAGDRQSDEADIEKTKYTDSDS